MLVQLKTSYDTDRRPSWIGWVEFTQSWGTARCRGRELRRLPGMFDANCYDVETHEEFWISGLDFELAVAANGLTATVTGGLHRSGIPTAALFGGMRKPSGCSTQLESTPEFAGRREAVADLSRQFAYVAVEGRPPSDRHAAMRRRLSGLASRRGDRAMRWQAMGRGS